MNLMKAGREAELARRGQTMNPTLGKSEDIGGSHTTI
jgi:hypothetical protein